jgi:monoamine oxidase
VTRSFSAGIKMKNHYGSEPPDNETGWTYDGDGAWSKLDPDEAPALSRDGPRVAVVGGGPGGLFATYILNQRLPGASVTVFEATGRCGGKIETAEFSDGTPFEAGVAELYEYLGPGGGDPLRMLIEDDLGLPTVDIAGGAVVLRDEVLRDLAEVEEGHGYDTRRRVEAFHQKMAELMPLEKYSQRWQPDNDHPWADRTFRECIEEELRGVDGVDEAARDYIEAAVHSDLATESHTCNGLNGIKNVLMDNDKYMQLYHVVGGIERVVDKLLDKIRARVKTLHRATWIGKVGDKYHVTALEVGEDVLKERYQEFDAVLVALPNHWLRTIKWDGALALAIHETCAHYDLPAHYLRVSMLFDEKWWTDLEMPGEFWMMDMLNGCCCYDESTRWGSFSRGVVGGEGPGGEGGGGGGGCGHVLSFLIAGGDALLMCSANQSDDCITDYVLQCLPTCMGQCAQDHFVESRVDRYVGSINAQPGGWPAEELRGEHQPEPNGHPGVFLIGDYFFDSTLNAALMSANTAVELLLEHLGVESVKVTQAIEQLEAKDVGV